MSSIRDVVSMPRFKGVDVGRQNQSLGLLALCVVVAEQKVDGDASLVEAPHLLCEIDAGVVVLPRPVIQVPGYDDEVDLFGNGFGHKIRECLSRGRSKHLNGSVRVCAKSG